MIYQVGNKSDMEKAVKAAKDAVKSIIDSRIAGGATSEEANQRTNAGYTKKQLLTFTGEIDTTGWIGFKTEEGIKVSFTQVARRGAMPIPEVDKAKTFDDAIAQFVTYICASEGNNRFRVKDVRKVESSSRDGKTTYVWFEKV